MYLAKDRLRRKLNSFILQYKLADVKIMTNKCVVQGFVEAK